MRGEHPLTAGCQDGSGATVVNETGVVCPVPGELGVQWGRQQVPRRQQAGFLMLEMACCEREMRGAGRGLEEATSATVAGEPPRGDKPV